VEVGKGVRTDPGKVQAIVDMGRPRTAQELKSFLGSASYYKRFCKDFAHLAMPLRKVESECQSKTMDITPLWGPLQQRSFVAIKAALAAAPVLIFPDFGKPYFVVADCSGVAKGAALMQEKDGLLHPLQYISQALNDHERQYAISDQEGGCATWACRRFRPYLLGAHTVLITDHQALTALVKGKQLKNMRQQRYAMDLSELSLTIVHKAGSSQIMQLPDALSRLGYSKQHGESMVSMVEHIPIEQCTVQHLAPQFKAMQQTEFPAARAAAAGQGIPGGMVGLSKRLQQQKATFKPLEESLEEESLAVQAYNTVLVALLTAQARAPRRRSRRIAQQTVGSDTATAELVQAKLHEHEQEEKEEADSPGAVVPHEEGPQAAGEDAPKGVPAPAATPGTPSQLQEAGLEPVLEVAVLRQMQQQQPLMRALSEYIVDRRLPVDRLERIRVLETAPLYEVNQAGLLCRIRGRGDNGSLGVDLQVVVPEALRGTVIAGCHQGPEGHASVLKTFQKVRDRFYWPGMFLDVQRYLKYCSGCQLNAQVKGRAHITKHIEAAAPGETVVIDLLHFPHAKGHKYVLVAVDAYSRWAEVAAIQDKTVENCNP